VTEDRLLRIREAAEKLAISERTAWSLIQRGELPVVRVSKASPRIDSDDLADFIRERKTTNGKAAER
jgi:excisionase family DNA binding protein